jgi:hypothetical protein
MLRRTESVVSLVPRFGRRVQSVRAAAPTSWTRRLRQKTCRFCHRLFAICVACDRGHAYCSSTCRGAGRRRSITAARQRHRRSLEGRLDHRDHQRAYRARVRDQTSRRPASHRRLPADTPTDPSPTAPLAGSLRCMVCGRESAWLLPPRWRIRRVSLASCQTAALNVVNTILRIPSSSRRLSVSNVHPQPSPSRTRRSIRPNLERHEARR